MSIKRVALVCGLLLISTDSAWSQETVPARAVLQVGDTPPSQRTGFFYGDEGYILTVLDWPEAGSLIGTSLLVRFWKNDAERVEDRAVVVDVLPKSGLALLRLTAADYPHDTSLVWADGFRSSRRPMKTSGRAACRIATPQPTSPFYSDQPCTLTGRGQPDGNLHLDPAVSRNQIGAPVFVEGKVVGVVGMTSVVYPISYAGRLLTMTESVPELVERIATAKSMISLKDQEHWKKFVAAVEAVQLSTPISVELKRRATFDASTDLIVLTVKVEPLMSIMRDPDIVVVEAFPQLRYRSAADPRKPIVVSWTEGFSRGVALKQTFKDDRAPTHAVPQIEEFSLIKLQGELIDMLGIKAANPDIMGFMVFMRWEVKGEGSRVRSHRTQEYIELPPR